MGTVTVLNTSILTEYGSYRYEPRTLEDIQAIINHSHDWQSAIGHQSTAQIISELLDVECPVNRILYKQQVDDLAVVFKLKGRPEEGKILSREEIEAIGYEWGILTRH
jgi:hypothetical protein